jgi:hypothetical protein
MTTKRLGAWLGLAIAGLLCGCSPALRGPEVGIPKSCLVASRSTGALCRVRSDSVAVFASEPSSASRANDDRVPFAWLSSQRRGQ